MTITSITGMFIFKGNLINFKSKYVSMIYIFIYIIHTMAVSMLDG